MMNKIKEKTKQLWQVSSLRLGKCSVFGNYFNFIYKMYLGSINTFFFAFHILLSGILQHSFL